MLDIWGNILSSFEGLPLAIWRERSSRCIDMKSYKETVEVMLLLTNPYIDSHKNGFE